MAVTTWQIDPAHSTVEFSVKHMMFTTVRGRFKTFSGAIEVDAENPDRSKVTVEIDAATIDSGVADRDAHLRSGDFLEAEQHPKIVFRSSGVNGAHANPGDRFTVEGTLEVRGQALPVTLNATFEGIGKDPWGNERAGFTARAEIDRRDWGLKWNQALETGGILVGNAVRIEIEAQAIRQQQTGRAVA
jgi:polyisoprenoid-binding protein YceI